MVLVQLFPATSSQKSMDHELFMLEVAARFGLIPNFFRTAPDTPNVARELWQFAKSAYLDTPIPTLFKERLFVYLSRFCEVRYCIVRHCGFLLGLGQAAGDPDASVMTIEQVIRLLQRAVPSPERTSAALARLEAIAEPIDWPSPETSYDDDLLTSCTMLFLHPARAERANQALRSSLGGEKFELLGGFLTFIRSAHYWTLMHPELAFEDDVKELLRQHEGLASLLLKDCGAGQCEMGPRLFEELESLRNLNQRQELEKAKHELEEIGRQKDLLLKEVNHRVKNSLQIVAGLLSMQARTAGAAAGQFHRAAARVSAVAAVHHQLQNYEGIGTLCLDRFVIDLCRQIEAASEIPDGTPRIVINADPLVVSIDLAIPLALILNEVVTNAIQHASPTAGDGKIRVSLETREDHSFALSVLDSGPGPEAGHVQAGLGTQIVKGLTSQINAGLAAEPTTTGYRVTVTGPPGSIASASAGAAASP